MIPAASHPLHLVGGFTIWIVWFSVAYGAVSVACSVAPAPIAQGPWTWINGALLALTFATAALLAALGWRSLRAARGTEAGRQRFFARAGALAYAASVVCTLVVGLPIAWLPPCT